ncbi:phage portal protein [Psittacicella hinzii]|uniref:Phage portal protein n=1 Tax=Psittacicella hinzii TaxID=2028575 RepID=A0A3A1YQG3_9GAMM|nr:phage portal protein [Psittacicella hinzii]RIY39489.1 hypothetical protein CKF58_02170 [Psittacicella hinzii]
MGFFDFFKPKVKEVKQSKGKQVTDTSQVTARLLNYARGYGRYVLNLHKAIQRTDYYSPSFDYQDINVTLSQEGLALMQISRDLAANNPIARSILHQFRGMLVGKNGYGVQPIPLKDYQTVDKELGVLLDYEFAKFCEQPVLNNRNLNFTAFLNYVVECWLRDGDCFIQIIRDFRKKEMKLKLWTADRLPYNSIAIGSKAPIELDDYGTPLYFNFVVDTDIFHNAHTIRVPAQDIIQLAERREPNQLRGVPVYASVVPALAQLENYRYNELMNSSIGAQILGELSQRDAITSDEDAEIAMHTLGEAISYFKVPTGYEYKVYSGQNRTNPNYDAFYKAQIRTIASGVGLDAESISNHFESSYSAARQSMIYASARTADKMNLLVNANKLLYKAFVDFFFLIHPELNKEDYLDPYNVTITTPQMKSINPVDDANATVTLIKNGIITRQQAANEQGFDVYENLNYIASERDYMLDNGLEDLFSVQYDMNKIPSEAANSNESDDQEQIEVDDEQSTR